MFKETYVSYEIAMIRAEELMIGDWVMYNPNVFIEDEYEPTKECFPTKINNGEDIDLAIEYCYIPLPITPEILEKNGFYAIYKDEKSAYKWKKYDDSDNTQSIVIDFERKRLSEVWNDRTRKSYKGEIVYVHELQHIIKVCGISKTIEL